MAKLKSLEQLRAEWLRQNPGKALPSRMAATSKPTPDHARLVAEAIQARDKAAATASAPAYAAAGDYLEMVQEEKRKRGCGFVEAAHAVLKTEAGQAAHKAFLRKKNPGVEI
jgi:hypothetical protein